ncbi:FAD-binding protein [Faecalibacterium prausnitzii]|uniref:FAD-binding protein n=1 Tax=Faecalibacterium prausnitzii TaxID=853 RepID=UPI0020B6BA67|nr:FAD-binding protein [Faecalibacterium prausnitzii]MCQ5157200.1 FAD-binding protein [Faecalibacterium prausnitzii]
MKKISRKGFLKVAAAAAMSGVTASALAACNAGSSSSTAASTGEAIYTPGTYTGTATGIGEVKVTMTFSETAITDVVIDASNETESIGGVAAPTLKDALMAAQSTEIDNISGATITTNAVKKAAASCIEQAMGVHTAGGDTAASSSDEDWLGTEPEIDESKVAKTVDVDVAVVGCGIAGVAACRSVAEEGGLVAAFEKADGPQCRSGEYAVINGKVQAKWGRDTWTREQIDDIIDSHMVESTYRCKRSIMSKWAHNIGDAFDWWVEANPDLYYAETTRSAIPDESADNFIIPIFYPLPEHYDWKQERFPCYPTSVEFKPDQHVTVEANMQKAIDTGNVQTFYGCFVEKLIMDNGRCVGLYARDAATGEYIKCNASKGVILSTGDYSQNTKMLKHFCPEVIENNIQCLFTNVDVEGNFTNQGDGIQLGMWAGAQVQQSHAPMIHHMGGGADLAGVGVMGNAGFLNLDLNGKRFMNEDLPGQQLENQIELQKNRESWQIFDSNWPEQLPYMPAAHGGACYYEDYASEDEGPKNNTTYRNYKSPYQLEAAVADGRAVKADTLEELVAKIYPDDTAAQQTALDSIQRYNELAKAGYDEDFHKPASRMWAVENGPFYADKFTTALLLVCIGGLESDEDCHTFDADRNVIPGLYVAGNIQGNRFATEYPIGLKGVSHSMAMYYGYVAGKNALKDI